MSRHGGRAALQLQCFPSLGGEWAQSLLSTLLQACKVAQQQGWDRLLPLWTRGHQGTSHRSVPAVLGQQCPLLGADGQGPVLLLEWNMPMLTMVSVPLLWAESVQGSDLPLHLQRYLVLTAVGERAQGFHSHQFPSQLCGK